MTIDSGIIGSIIGTISLLIGGLLSVVINTLNNKIDSKQDSKVCEISHRQIKADIDRGQRNLDSIIICIRGLEKQLAENNIQISLLTQTIKSLVGHDKRFIDKHNEIEL